VVAGDVLHQQQQRPGGASGAQSIGSIQASQPTTGLRPLPRQAL
jgi:hypothetical protein